MARYSLNILESKDVTISFLEIKNHLDAGNRLDKPIHCDDKLYELLMRCWHDQRRQRPNFADLASFFNEHYKKIGLGVSII